MEKRGKTTEGASSDSLPKKKKFQIKKGKIRTRSVPPQKKTRRTNQLKISKTGTECDW